MFSDDLDDKIAQILRGNFSPAKNAIPSTQPAVRLPTPPIVINSSYSEKPGIAMGSDKIVTTSSTLNDGSLVKSAVGPSQSIVVPGNRRNVVEATTETQKTVQSKSVISTVGSTNVSNNSIRQETESKEVLSETSSDTDISAMIQRLQKSSREPSPTTLTSSSSSPPTPIINDPVGVHNERRSNTVTTSVISSEISLIQNAGIASYSETESEHNTQALADESVMDDLLFGELETSSESVEFSNHDLQSNLDVASKSAVKSVTANNSSKSTTEKDKTSVETLPVSKVHSPVSPVASKQPVSVTPKSTQFRNFENRPSALLYQHHDDPPTYAELTHSPVTANTTVDDVSPSNPPPVFPDVKSELKSKVEMVNEDMSIDSTTEHNEVESAESVVEEEESPLVLIMRQQQRLLQQQQQMSPSKSGAAAATTVPIAIKKSSASPGRPPVNRDPSPSAIAAARRVEASVKPPPPSLAPTKSAISVGREEQQATPVAPTVEVKTVSSSSRPTSTAPVITIPVSARKAPVMHSPMPPAAVQQARAVPVVVPRKEPEVRLEEVYRYAENDDNNDKDSDSFEVEVIDDENEVEEEDVQVVVSKQKQQLPRKQSPIGKIVTKSTTPKKPASHGANQTSNPMHANNTSSLKVPVNELVNKESVTIKSALARGSAEGLEKKSSLPSRPASATRARASATTPSEETKLSVQSPARYKEAPDFTPAVSTSSPSRREAPHAERPVKVAVRVRPFTTNELSNGARRTIARNGEKLIIVNPKAFDADPDTIAAAAVAMDNKQWAQIFQFNHFLWSRDSADQTPPTELRDYANQQDVFNIVGQDIVDSVLNGVSASCFAYGHTGTGKTHSLFGNIVGNNSHKSRSGTPMKGVQSSQAASTMTAAALTNITPESGLIPRVMYDIVSAINSRDIFGNDTRMFFTFVEIYNEKIIDLLVTDAAMLESVRHSSNDNSASVAASALKAREHPVFGTYVENLSKVEVSSPEEVLRLIARGQSNRATTCTAWNTTSSRSHAIVTLELSPANFTQNVKFISPSAKNNDKFHKNLSGGAPNSVDLALASRKEAMASLHSNPVITVGSSVDPHQHLFTRVQMVDLAGSEKDSNWGSGANSSSHDDNGIWKGTRYNDTTPNKLAEAVADKEKNELKLIRRSLSTLGYIIKALAKGAAFKSLPYRDSVLTFLLRDALNGHNHTTMLATVSPADNCYEETLSTLRYAEKLCSLRNVVMPHHPGAHHHMNHSISYGSPVTSLVALDKDMQQSRKALLEEFTKIHNGLGHNKPGSNASRQLHYQTISDPQQRIAKMTKLVYNTEFLQNGEGVEHEERLPAQNEGIQTYSHISSSNNLTTPSGKNRRTQNNVSFTSPVDGSTKDLYSLTTSDLDALKNSYRLLQTQLIETQIDLDSVKVDRDSLAVDLKVAREQVLNVEQTKSDTRTSISSLTRSVKTAEKEINEYRLLLQKKEENIERLVSEISSEKQGRLDAEHAYHARTKDFLTRFEVMKKENKSLSANLEISNSKYKNFGEEKKDLLAQIDKLRVLLKSLTIERDALTRSKETLTEENSSLKQQIELIGSGMSTELSDYERANSELTLLITRLQATLGTLTAERDELSRMLVQKDALLVTQSEQAELSIKMLQQRQAALDKSELAAAAEVAVAAHNEDFGRLHESLRELFASEGQVLHSELLDTKKLTAMVRELREKMVHNESLQSHLDREKGITQSLHAKFQEYRTQSDLHAEHVRLETTTQLDYLRKQLEESRTRINTLTMENQKYQQLLQHQQQLVPTPQSQSNSFGLFGTSMAPPPPALVAEHSVHNIHTHNEHNTVSHTSSNVNSSSNQYSNSSQNSVYMSNALEIQLRTENNLLREQLLQAQNECTKAREDARSSIESQQKELSSLWTSMQELNRVDAAKDLTIHDLIGDRDRALKERDALAERLRLVTQECTELQQDLREMDADLVAAVEMTSAGAGRMPTGGLALHKVSDRMMHGIMRRRQKQTGATPVPQFAGQFDFAAHPQQSRSASTDFQDNYTHNQQQRTRQQTFEEHKQYQQGQTYADPNFTQHGSSGGLSGRDGPQSAFSVHESHGRQHQQQFSHNQHNQHTHYHESNSSSRRVDDLSPQSIPSVQSMYSQPTPYRDTNIPPRHHAEGQSGSVHKTRFSENEQYQHDQQRTYNTSTQQQQQQTHHQSHSQRVHSSQKAPPAAIIDEYDISEKILQRQIEELSDFLDDEAKLKRSRLQRGSNGSLSSLAQSIATKRPKLYTPTTKLNFEF